MPKVIGGRARAVQNKGYSHGGASHTKKALKGFYVESGSPAEDINANNYTLRQRSRILYQTAPIATAALKRQRTNIIGSGLRLKSTIDRTVLGMSKEQAADWQRLVQREFALWASNGRLPIDRPAPVLPGVFRTANVQGAERIHQTQKPVEVMRQICRICVPSGLIVDPFAGSGTTLAAAREEGYDVIGIELSKEIAERAAQRLGVPLKEGTRSEDDGE